MYSRSFARQLFILSIFTSISMGLISCGGGSKLSLEEAENVTLNFQGENFVPPPRGIDELLKKIKKANTGSFCVYCDLDTDTSDIESRLFNMSKSAIRLHFQGKTDQAIEMFRGGYKLFKSVDNSEMNVKQRYVLLNRFAMLAQDVGSFSDAVKYLEEGIEINRNAARTLKGSLVVQYCMLSEVHSEAGNIEEAEDALDNASYTFSEIRNPPASSFMYIPRWHLQIKIAKAKLANARGELREAEKLFQQLLVDLEDGELPPAQGFYESQSASIRGFYLVQNLLSQGRVAEAEAESRKAVEFALDRFGRDTFASAVTLKGMIEVLMARGEYEDAMRLVDITDAIFKAIKTSDSSIELAQLRTLQAEIYIAQDDWASAAHLFTELDKKLGTDKKAHKLFFQANLDWAIVLANSGNLARAEKVAQQALAHNEAIYGSQNSRTIMAKGVLAMVNAKQGQQNTAFQLYRNIIPLLVKGQTESAVRYDVGSNGQRLAIIIESYLAALHQQYKTGNKAAAEEAFYTVQLIQGKGTQNAVASSAARASIKNPKLIVLVRKEQDATQKIEAGYNKLATLLAAEKNNYYASITSELKEQLKSLTLARESILEEIREQFPEYDNLARPRPVTADNIQKILKPGEALLLTYSGTKVFYSWMLTADGKMDYVINNASKSELKHLVMSLRKGLDLQATSLSEIPDFDTELSYRLYEKVLKPTVHLWRSAKNLVIVPDAVLGTLPFSVLVTEKNHAVEKSALRFSGYRDVAWLAKTHATSYSPSVITLNTLRNKHVKEKAALRFIGFGNPDFGSGVGVKDSGQLKTRGINLTMRGLRRTTEGNLDASNVTSSQLEMLNPLPETADEVLQVAGVLQVANKGNVFLGKSANEERVKHSVLDNRRILMFASHALLPGDLDGLTQPAIALSSPKVTGSKNDGLLTMSEVMGLNLNADWVVLSACNTGAGSGRGATAVSGLGQAFFYAGARSLLVSHWPVETTSAKVITTGLFERQVQNHSLSRAMALNETVKDLMQNKTFKDKTGKSVFAYAHPVFWAPFTLVGDGSGVLIN